jgi:hypothetical protein
MESVPLGVFLLVMISSVFHAIWNFFARRVKVVDNTGRLYLKGNMGVLYLGLFVAAACLIPAVILVHVTQSSFVQPKWNLNSLLFIFLTCNDLFHFTY